MNARNRQANCIAAFVLSFRHIRLILARLLVMASIMAIGGVHSDLTSAEVKIGVRSDAPPFSYQTDDRPGTYEGFLVELCQLIMNELDEPYVFHRVSAESRFRNLKEGRVDFLCEPTSVNPHRLSELAFSYPLFVTGLSYAQYANVDQSRTSRIVGMLKNTTAFDGLAALVDAGVFGFLTGSVERNNSENSIETFDTHYEGVLGLCRGDVFYYVADKDILHYLIDSIPKCQAYAASETFTREMYALTFASPISSDFSKFSDDRKNRLIHLYWNIQKVIFFLYQTNRIDDIFARHFPRKNMSKELRYFYDIGKIRISK